MKGRIKNYALMVALMAVFCLCFGVAQAGPLKYEPRNPSFGGPPLNGQHMLQKAKTQDPHGMLEEDSSGWQREEKTDQEKLEEAFQRRLRYDLVESTMDQMSNENEQLQPGEYQIGDNIVRITESDGSLEVVLETSTGQTTVTIPQ